PRRRPAAPIGLRAVPLRQLFGTPAREFLQSRVGAVLVDSPARLEPRLEGGIDLTVRDTPVAARVVVAAVEWHNLSRLFRSEPPGLLPVLDAAASTPGVAILSAHVWLDRPVMDVPFLGLPGREWQWIFAVGRHWHGR